MLTSGHAGFENEVLPVAPGDADRLLQLQKDILENIAVGNDHQVVLDELCKTAESMLPGAVASIMLFNADHEALEVRSAPSIPDYGISQLNGLVPGPAAGSCGTAVFREEAQYVCNIADDPRWESMRELARDFSLASCWSNPIISQHGEVVGSFALSSFEPREPSDFHKQLLQVAASLASIVLKRQTEEELLQHAAHYDDLTDLPNRLLFSIRLRHAIKKAKRARREVAILFIDLDNFKIINDTRGHEQGDRVLISVTQRFCQVTREVDTLARLGGDEFVLLIEEQCEHDVLRYVASKLLACLEEPFPIGEQQYRLSASIGISRYPQDGEDKNVLLQNADLAMYEAKARGKNRYEFYDVALTYLINERVSKEADLRRALESDEFVVHFQPILNAKTGQVAGVEALVRWQHPEQGLLAPGAFITVAEDSGLIKPLGDLVTGIACQEAIRLIQNGHPQLQLSVNLSVKQLESGLYRDIVDILEATGFPPENMQMEVTESLIMEQANLAISELLKLQESGIQIAMDDFGTGHSSLAQLKSLPMDKLKIDRSFVMGLPHNLDDVIICQTIIAMGHSLGYEVVAEGVETEEQKEFLRANDCDYLQGYLFAKPMGIVDCEDWLARHQPEDLIESE